MAAAVAIVGGRVLTVDDDNVEHTQGVVLVEGDTIVAIEPEVRSLPRGIDVIDASGCLVMPGLVNAHTHVSQTLLRGGLSHSRILYDWLMNVVLPGLRAYRDGDLKAAVHLYCAEALRCGVTTIVANEEPVSDDARADVATVLEALGQTGIRAAYAFMFRDQEPVAVHAGFERRDATPLPHEAVDQTLALIEELAGEYGTSLVGPSRLAVWPSPATTAVVSDHGLRATHALAKRVGGRWALHLAETGTEAMVRDVSPVAHLERLGCLDDTLLAAHCVHVDEADIQALARTGVAVVTNPVSNSYLGSGIAPIPRMLAAGVQLALGTDDGNCNDSVNLISDMKVLALLHRAVSGDPAALSPEAIVRMATIEAARGIGLGDLLGSLEPGKRADIAIVRTDVPQFTPMHDPYATLVFQAAGTEVSTVLVDGNVVVRDGQPLFTGDLASLCADAAARSARIAREAGLVALGREL